jgi:hypothetical protein
VWLKGAGGLGERPPHLGLVLRRRLTYTGGYVLPGTSPPPPVPPATPLPKDLEDAATEQVAYRFQKREKLGLRTSWPNGGEYKQFGEWDLLRPVASVLQSHKRYSL